MRSPEQATRDQTGDGVPVFSTHPFLWEDPHWSNLMGEILTVKYKPENEFSNSLDYKRFSIEIKNIKGMDR